MAGHLDELRRAYEGLEVTFADRDARDRYRASALVKTAEQADFIAARLESASVLEVGCGNGRLLIELARRGRIAGGVGIDLAQSRIEFAREWARDLGLGALRFEVADALAYPVARGEYGAIACITGAFAYFEAVRARAGEQLAARWARALVPHGLLVLELYPHPELTPLIEAARGSLRLWRELPPEDPWRFYLSDLRIEAGILIHDKTFVHRTSGQVDAGRRERIRLYTATEISDLLACAGFADVELHEGWTEHPYEHGESMVVTARRAG